MKKLTRKSLGGALMIAGMPSLALGWLTVLPGGTKVMSTLTTKLFDGNSIPMILVIGGGIVTCFVGGALIDSATNSQRVTAFIEPEDRLITRLDPNCYRKIYHK